MDEEQIYNILCGAYFEDWHSVDFLAHVEGEKDAKTKEQILEDIKKMFITPFKKR
jgi:hypothetical protein